ncbi:Na+/H+ antiporter NhaC [Nocardioides massiliensis]|uniref:Na+/H+ antiporter NhaC n=3 Tax=Nocardioides massiliensis TaxID=1325935 RepID=A0ABT9NLT6_9ACTN|nr:Na+/H+ antiporter NhaC family protein [Nocardioides massiliensis]MDP9821379.1 Na+/H+ antiporter NhaC [Nocardioides massiliensis]
MIESAPILTLVPPLLAIVLVIATRKVLLSLGLGVVSAAFLTADLDPLETARLVLTSFTDIFWVDGAVNTDYVFILVFTILLGVIAAFIMMSGGTRAFGDWAAQRIRTRRGSLLLPTVLGVVIFIDDYFNALAVGQVSRPLTDKHRVSRAKLTYVVDSTSAPVAVLMPFSSWGAYILGVIGPIVAASALSMSAVQAMFSTAALNYYAWAALLSVVLTVVLTIDFGPMRAEERRALVEGDVHGDDADIPGQLSEDLPIHRHGAANALVVPFVLLVIGVLGGITWTGYAASGSWSVIDILAEADVGIALVAGGLLGLAGALYYYVRDTAENPKFGRGTFGRGWVEGARSMWPAISILLLAWMLGGLVEQLGTGDYLGGLVEDAPFDTAWLVPVMFLVAAGMAFATGTSWGSFGLLLPIAGGIMNSVDAPELLLPAFGAVLAGAVAGDHASPISDTSILSATGAGCDVVIHVVTQLPYAVLAALAAGVGYVAFALTSSGTLGLVLTLAVTAGLALGVRAVRPPVTSEDDAVADAGEHADDPAASPAP